MQLKSSLKLARGESMRKLWSHGFHSSHTPLWNIVMIRIFILSQWPCIHEKMGISGSLRVRTQHIARSKRRESSQVVGGLVGTFCMTTAKVCSFLAACLAQQHVNTRFRSIPSELAISYRRFRSKYARRSHSDHSR